jgi:hypothetical protein
MSAESLQAYKYAAELVGVGLGALAASIPKNVKSMPSAQGGTGAAANAYKTLGVAATDSKGYLRDAETVHWESTGALGKASSETDRDALAMQTFGKSARGLNALIAQDSAGIAALAEKAKNMGAAMGDDALNALGSFGDSIALHGHGDGGQRRDC